MLEQFLRWTLNWASCLLVVVGGRLDVKDPTVSFVKSRRAIAGTMAKLQIPALTTIGKAKANYLL